MARDRYHEAFLADLENWCLAYPRWDARLGLPRGRFRHMDPLWREVVQENIDAFPRDTWADYVRWCEAGRGDEWFQMELAEGDARHWTCTCEDPFCTVLVNGETAGDLHGVGAPLGASAEDESGESGCSDHGQAGRRVRQRSARSTGACTGAEE